MTETTTRSDDRSDLSAIAAVLKRRLWLVVVGVLVGVGAAILFAHLQPKRYQSTATLLFRPVYLDVAVTGATLQVPASDPTRDAATNVSLVSQHNVMARAARRLGPPYTASSLSRDVSISSIGKTDLVGVQATAATPREAARAANAVARAYLVEAGAVVVGEIHQAQRRIQQELRAPQLTSLQRVALEAARTKLAVLALLGPENVHLSQGAVPPNRQSSPRPTLDVIIGGLAGLLVGLALAFATEQFDPRLRRPEEVERETGLPVLATIPQQRSLARPVAGQSYEALGSMEPFERLVSVLRHAPAVREARTVLVISPEVASGQTTVALRLALAAAGGLSMNTLLVEADLRRPRVAELAGLSTDRGLSTMLSGESQELEVQQLSLRAGPSSNGRRLGLWRPARQAQERAATAVVETPVTDESAGSDLTILPAGPPTAEATALLASDGMRNLMRIWAASYDLTVIDGPPPNRVADVIPLANEADAVLVVARLGKDTVQELTRLRIELARIGVEPLGVVANFARQTKNPYAL